MPIKSPPNRYTCNRLHGIRRRTAPLASRTVGLQVDRTYTSTAAMRTPGADSGGGPVGVYVLSSCRYYPADLVFRSVGDNGVR
jgi:hypothetical protein